MLRPGVLDLAAAALLAAAAPASGQGMAPAPSQAGAPPSPLGLQAAVALALAQNPDVQSARFELAESRFRGREARAAFWPQIRYASALGQSNNLTSLLGGGTTGTTDDLATVLAKSQAQFTTLRLAGSMTLWDWGRNGTATAIADADELVAFERLRLARQDVAYQARSAYLGLVRARSASRLAAQAAARARAHQVAIEKRQARGVETELAVLRAEARTLELQQEAGQAARRERESESELALLLGTLPGKALDVMPFESDAGSYALEPEPDAIDRALVARPDVRIAAIQVRQDELRREDAARSALPGLYLSASGGAVASTVSGLTPDLAVAGTVAGPLFDGFRSSSALERAGVALARSRQARERLAARVRVDVQTARHALLEAIDRQRLAEREGAVAARALAAARSQQHSGVATKLDVLDEELAALQAEQRAAEAHHDRSLAETRLAKALGEDPSEARLDDAPPGWKVP